MTTTTRTRARIIFALFSAAALFFAPSAAHAWFSGEAGYQQLYTDNFYLISDKDTDWICRPFLKLDFGPFAGFTPYYEASGYLYPAHAELNSYLHRIGAEYAKSFGENRNVFFLDPYYLGSLHVEDSQDMDFHEGGLSVGFRFRRPSKLMIQPSISGSYRTFPNVGDLSFVEWGGGLLLNKSFESKTTLRLFGRIDDKRFLEDVQTESSGTSSMSMQSSALTADESDETQTKAGSGRGNGAGNGNGNSSGGSGNGSSGVGNNSSVANSDTVEAMQVFLSARVAQGFGKSVGTYIEGTYRQNLLDPPRYVEGTIPSVDREVFDDRFGYEGPGANAQVSFVLPSEVDLAFKGFYESRLYEGRTALDEDGAAVTPKQDRRDDRLEVSASLDWKYYFDRAFPGDVKFSLSGGHTTNRSNDAWYDAEENWISGLVSLEW